LKLALLADVHSNLEALEACLEHARASGAEGHAFIGDLVGYAADPVAVLAAAGAVVVRGNHDQAVLDGNMGDMNAAAQAAIAWTRERLTDRHRAFLEGLPLVARRDNALFVHASAASPETWTYVSDPLRAHGSLQAAGDARYVFSGHVHEPVLYYMGPLARPLPFRPVPGVAVPVPARRQWLAIVGSAGQPRDGSAAACYALLDQERSTLTFQRVPYDWSAAARKITAAGLPERLALRLAKGE
jgi:diadenosine tetraphosphatase ApaH/serine/threonine PP2A family protein phosphatase